MLPWGDLKSLYEPQTHGLTVAVVTSAEQIQHIVSRGYEQRTVGCHDINAHSSRSHCLLIIQVTATDTSTGIRTIGKLTLCKRLH